MEKTKKYRLSGDNRGQNNAPADAATAATARDTEMRIGKAAAVGALAAVAGGTDTEPVPRDSGTSAGAGTTGAGAGAGRATELEYEDGVSLGLFTVQESEPLRFSETAVELEAEAEPRHRRGTS